MRFAELPALAAAASVLVMPYRDAPVTRAMQPLKLKEYLATGKPAVVRSLPETDRWADAVDVASSPEAFTALVNERLTSGFTHRPIGSTAAFEFRKLGRKSGPVGVMARWVKQ